MNRTPNPRNALDFPDLADDLWVIWSSNGKKWPAADRQLSYLSANRAHVMKGFALYSMEASDAATFTSEQDARAWLAENENKRTHPYGVNVTTVAALKSACGFTVEG